MYTILIVDDEREEREGVSFLLAEFEYDLEILYAENGKQAIEVLEKRPIDILYTDIRMPIMDGLELSKQARDMYPNMPIIIYSGYAEFQYAKTAISIGVAFYILKPVDMTEFKKTMDQVLHGLAEVDKSKELLGQQEHLAKKHQLVQLIYRSEHSNMEESKQFEYERLILLEFDKDFFDQAGEAFEQELLPCLPLGAEYLNLNMCQGVVLCKRLEGDQVPLYEQVAGEIHEWILKRYQTYCYIALSEDIIPGKIISEVYQELESLLECRFFITDKYIFDKNQVIEEYIEGEDAADDVITEQIKKDILAKDIYGLEIHLNLFCNKYQKKNTFSHLYVKFIFSNVYKDILTDLGRNQVREEDLNKNIDKLYRSNDMKQIIILIHEAVDEIKGIWEKVGIGSSQEVDMVKNYIDQHYGEDLDLVSLAEKVYLSPPYLSTLFKRVTGWGINKYIKNLRMEKAKILLEQTNIKIVDLAEAVGFHNLSYFCQNFREFYGETPEQYRKTEYYQNKSGEKGHGCQYEGSI